MKKLISIVFVLIILCVVPISISVLYYPETKIEYKDLKSWAYIWVDTTEEFKYFILGGVSSYKATGKMGFEFVNEDKRFEFLKIGSATVIQNNVKEEIREIVGKSYVFDESIHNMFAGQGATCSVSFSSPIQANNDFKISITGELKGALGNRSSFSFEKNIIAKVDQRKVPLFLYIWYKFTST